MGVPRLFSTAGLLLGLTTTGMFADKSLKHEHYSPMGKIKNTRVSRKGLVG